MRRTKAEIDSIKLSIYDLCARYQPMTVRQLFYQLTTIGAIDKTEAEYKGTVCRLTKEMRLNGELPWDWLADNTRWMHKPRTYGGISDLLESSQRAYRRALWDPSANPDYCEVWIEKDALTGVFLDVTSEFDVPLMPCKGYPSLSFIRQAAETIKDQIEGRLGHHSGGPKVHIYYFGDFDPSGVDISRSTEARLREFIREMGSVGYEALFLGAFPLPPRCGEPRPDRSDGAAHPSDQKSQTAAAPNSVTTSASRLMPLTPTPCVR